jgi:hypothetical protein
MVIRGMGREPGGSGHVQLLLGAYVLGGLSPEDKAAVEAHLSECGRCRAECEELKCVPSWLDLLKPGETDPAPDQLGD